MFMALGLRHLVVVDSNSWPAGMITRRDLDVAAGPGGYWRRNKVRAAAGCGHSASAWAAHLCCCCWRLCAAPVPHLPKQLVPPVSPQNALGQVPLPASQAAPRVVSQPDPQLPCRWPPSWSSCPRSCACAA